LTSKSLFPRSSHFQGGEGHTPTSTTTQTRPANVMIDNAQQTRASASTRWQRHRRRDRICSGVHIGPDTQLTVYAAELQGISLALQIAQGYASGDGELKDIAIYTDNQAAIWSIAKAKGRSGAYILAEIAQQVLELQNKGYSVTVRWISAHVGIPGNEAADQAAKEATGWREDGRSQQPADPPAQLYPLRTTLRRLCKMQVDRA
jgi:ribonuclease HI